MGSNAGLVERDGLVLSVLGSGCGVLRSDRGPTALLFACRGESLLIDIGPGTARRLASFGDPFDLGALALSHLHADHVCDLPALLFAYRNTPGKQRQRALTLLGPTGLLRHLELLRELYGHSIEPECGVDPRELAPDGGSLSISENMRLRWISAEHGGRPALSFRIEAAGRSVVCTADSGPSPRLVELARNADLLVAECSAADQQPLPGHLAPGQIGSIAAQAQVKRVLLVHLYPHSEAADPLAGVAAQFSGEVLLGHDGLILDA